LRDRFRQFNDATSNSSDPRVKAAGDRCAKKLGPQIENYMKHAHEGLKSGSSESTQNQRPKLGKNLAQFRVDADSLQDDCLVNENHGASILEAQANLREAMTSGDKNRIRNCLDALRAALQAYNNNIAPAVSKHSNPGKRENLAHQARAPEDFQTDLARMDPNMDSHLMSRALVPLEPLVVNFSDSMRSDTGDDFVKGVAMGVNLSADIVPGGEKEGDLEMSGLLKRAGDMSDLLRGMVGHRRE